MSRVHKSRLTPRKALSRIYRPHALSNDEHLYLEELTLLGKVLAEVIGRARGSNIPVQPELLQWLASIDAERQQLAYLPKIERMPRNTRVHRFKTVVEALGLHLGRRDGFENMFLFSPEQVIRIAALLFPNGFESPKHGRLGSEEAMLMLLAAFRDRHRNFAALAFTLCRDPDNLSRHIKNMIADIDRKYSALLDTACLKIHAEVDINNVARKVPIWRSAMEKLFETKFPGINRHEFFDGICLVMDGLRYDVTRCSFSAIEESTYSGYSRTHDLVWGVLIAPDGLVLALIGPYSGRHNDHVFITQELEKAVTEIQAKVLADGIFAVRDWLRPLPCARDKENYEFAENQVAAYSALRMPIEWTIGNTKASFPFAFVGARNKVLQTDITARLRVSFLLRNLYTLMNGSGTSKYFSLRQTTTPEEYLARASVLL